MNESNFLVIFIIVVIVILIIIVFVRRDKKGSRHSSNSHQSNVVSYEQYSGRSVRNERPEFPRMEAKAGKKDIQETMKVNVAKAPVVQNAPQPKVSVPQVSRPVVAAPQPVVAAPQSKKSGETVFVRNMAELFSPKEDVEAELGVSQETLNLMVAEYKKTKEYKERKLPINRHFDMDKYTQATQTIRQSSIPQKAHGDKKGKIVSSIYKKYGKHFASQKSHGVNPEIKATLTTQTQHQQAVRNAQGKSSQAKLATRIV